ncbi:hypothetical protein ACFPTO_05890 [Paraburkholderia denitrificans]|uniref:Uncharacterized protein n=1 Tax=Paraburkholderia denitrificans TaxID=694025 RepID=A0ABW0J5R9_9BURK
MYLQIVQSGYRSVGWRASDIDAFLADPANYRAAASNYTSEAA